MKVAQVKTLLDSKSRTMGFVSPLVLGLTPVFRTGQNFVIVDTFRVTSAIHFRNSNLWLSSSRGPSFTSEPDNCSRDGGPRTPCVGSCDCGRIDPMSAAESSLLDSFPENQEDAGPASKPRSRPQTQLQEDNVRKCSSCSRRKPAADFSGACTCS